ncbi:hypothetical protein GOEFS_119_00100 [Gordonia effusa NBRC 100432]|uniref:Uncharacterized protein n=1 Tax=Gordonia effusa NBRC 100432 TaxID=1077974 RepID=H0R619_9ACTN|nr:hypothetical protein [Gordonia effusa]GAB20520.1 hypothetical protein GOEFS_119_00100 [Gordonia effusa NBRC 100432]
MPATPESALAEILNLGLDDEVDLVSLAADLTDIDLNDPANDERILIAAEPYIYYRQL